MWCHSLVGYAIRRPSGHLVHSLRTSQRRVLQTSCKAAGTAPIVLGFKPLAISYTQNGQFILVGGTSNGIHMYTREGVSIDKVVAKDAWVWATSARPGGATDEVQVACGCEDGSVSLELVSLPVTHALHRVRLGCLASVCTSSSAFE
jgi:hypothetical protein